MVSGWETFVDYSLFRAPKPYLIVRTIISWATKSKALSVYWVWKQMVIDFFGIPNCQDFHFVLYLKHIETKDLTSCQVRFILPLRDNVVGFECAHTCICNYHWLVESGNMHLGANPWRCAFLLQWKTSKPYRLESNKKVKYYMSDHCRGVARNKWHHQEPCTLSSVTGVHKNFESFIQELRQEHQGQAGSIYIHGWLGRSSWLWINGFG